MSPDSVHGSLDGRRVMVVEDEYMIADELRRFLERAGSVVIGPAPSTRQVLDLLAKQEVDLAVLDVNLNGERTFDLAETLTARGVAYVFVTGYDGSALPVHFANVPCCEKPVDFRQLIDLLADRQAEAGSV